MQNFVENKRVLKTVDFNCDLAQGWGVFQNSDEVKFLDYVSSVNIACGLHSGDPLSIKYAFDAIKDKNIAIGAHIGFPDISGFGNRAMNLSEEEIEAIVLYQLGAIITFAQCYGLRIEHVRPHGAMYKMAATSFDFSLSLAKAIKKAGEWLIYVGAAGEIIERVKEEANITVARELQLNLPYNTDGTAIYDRGEITNIEFCLKRLEKLLRNSDIKTIESTYINIPFDTIHFATTSPISLELVKKAYQIAQPTPVNYNNAYNLGWV